MTCALHRSRLQMLEIDDRNRKPYQFRTQKIPGDCHRRARRYLYFKIILEKVKKAPTLVVLFVLRGGTTFGKFAAIRIACERV